MHDYKLLTNDKYDIGNAQISVMASTINELKVQIISKVYQIQPRQLHWALQTCWGCSSQVQKLNDPTETSIACIHRLDISHVVKVLCKRVGFKFTISSHAGCISHMGLKGQYSHTTLSIFSFKNEQTCMTASLANAFSCFRLEYLFHSNMFRWPITWHRNRLAIRNKQATPHSCQLHMFPHVVCDETWIVEENREWVWGSVVLLYIFC